jgi:hypothetical protein
MVSSSTSAPRFPLLSRLELAFPILSSVIRGVSRPKASAIVRRVHGQDALRPTNEVDIGMADPELPQLPGVIGERTDDICTGLLSLTINSVDVVNEEDNLHTAAALSRREQAWALGFPVWRIVCRRLKSGLPTSQFSLLVCLASHDTKALSLFKPDDGLLNIAHSQLDPACFSHMLNHFLCSLTGRFDMMYLSYHGEGDRQQGCHPECCGRGAGNKKAGRVERWEGGEVCTMMGGGEEAEAAQAASASRTSCHAAAGRCYFVPFFEAGLEA